MTLPPDDHDALLLSEAELEALTGCSDPHAQVIELHLRGFERARLNRSGRSVLERAHYVAVCSTVHAERIQPAREPGEFLSADEVRDLTQRARKDFQITELKLLGIPYLVQRGRLLVSRFHVRERLVGRTQPQGRGINWAAIR